VPSQAQDRTEVFEVLNRYGEAADRRDWSLYDQVFTPDATADYPRRSWSAARRSWS
jgi:SnoaL-like domain